MISLVVGDGRGGVSVGGKIVKLGNSIVRAW